MISIFESPFNEDVIREALKLAVISVPILLLSIPYVVVNNSYADFTINVVGPLILYSNVVPLVEPILISSPFSFLIYILYITPPIVLLFKSILLFRNFS